MFATIDDGAPATAHRRAVGGFLIGTGIGLGFVAGVFALDIGGLATLWRGAGGIPIGELGLLPVTAGLVGLVVGPVFGGPPGTVPDRA